MGLNKLFRVHVKEEPLPAEEPADKPAPAKAAEPAPEKAPYVSRWPKM